jgi:preprotein translocase subunit SecB
MSEGSRQSPHYDIRKTYLKDVSFESPQSPALFLRADFKPQIDVQLRVENQSVEGRDGLYEVTLTATASARIAETTPFLVEVQQAGLFELRNFPDDQLEIMLEIACPNVLFPFLREAVSELVSKGGFPQLLLSPVNFEAMYHQRRAQQPGREERGAH